MISSSSVTLTPASGTIKCQFSLFPVGAYESVASIGKDDVIYVGDQYQRLLALTNNCTLKWSKPYAAEQNPAIDYSSNELRVPTHDQCLLSIDAATGALLWNVSLKGVPSCVVVDLDGTSYTGDDAGYFYAISSAGQLLWTKFISVIGSSVRVDNCPTVGLDGLVYVSSSGYSGQAGGLYAFRKNGTLLWSRPSFGSYSGLTDARGNLLYMSRSALVLLNSATGGTLWSYSYSPAYYLRPCALSPDRWHGLCAECLHWFIAMEDCWFVPSSGLTRSSWAICR